MQSWSDSFLNSVNHYAQIIGILALALTLLSAYFVYATVKELTGRASAREAASEAKAIALQKEASEAKQAADAAIRHAKALEEKQQPRSITDEQRELFISELRDVPKGKVTVMIFSHDAEITRYANQIRDMVSDAGFDVDVVKTDLDADWTPAGVILGVRDAVTQPHFAVPMQHAFSGIGIETEGMIDLSIEDNDTLNIIIGSK